MTPTNKMKIRFAFASLACFGTFSMLAQQTKLNLGAATVVSTSTYTNLPNFIKFNPGQNITESDFSKWAVDALGLSTTISFRSYDSQNDQIGQVHTRFKEYINNIPVEGTMLITHSKAGRIEMVNGDYYSDFAAPASPVISEQTALTQALKKVNAEKYKWENRQETQAMRDALHQPDFSYFPKGEIVLVHKDKADYKASNMRLAYKFNIYAEKPLSRAYIFVDATTGEVIAQQQIIHTADVVGTANTKFSGSQTMTSDNYGTATQYRLRETGRGNGIQTYNCNTGTTYTNTDFTNTSATWNLTGTNQAATDAHWGSEKTYDYYQTVHGRNSIDNAGYNLLSYVHYNVNYANAFWDGTRMTYGDGDVSVGFLIMTALDVCGHEITHGLTSFTANLNGGGSGEPDALNEGFSDIFGTTIEAYARPSQNDWIMGADITCTAAGVQDHIGIRDMSRPSNLGQPNCYLGPSWSAAGEPHTNDGPSIWWYYLLCQGGSGTNDLGNTYSVTGITMAEARLIAFRGLTNYFTSSTNYTNARALTIQAAMDLYGGCSPEVIATTNAWHAAGVGAAYVATPTTAAFTANSTSACSLPFTVNFSNTSVNGTSAIWNFGDGSTSTVYNPSHTYTSAGTFNVRLTVSSSCGTDSVVHSSYITITLPTAPSTSAAFSCTAPATVTLGASGGGTLNWFTAPTGGTSVYSGTTYTTPSLSTTTSYYVESQVPGAAGNVGPTTTTFGTGSLHNNTSTQYLIFDVLQPCTIQTVLVNSGAASTRNVLLWDNTGTLLQTIPVAFPSGSATVSLNLHMNPGTGYRLGGISMNLWRQNSGPAYPYTLSGVINITGSSAGASYYYFYYNWHVVNDPCVSARTPVTASIGGPAVTYSVAAYDTVCVTASAFPLTGGSPASGTYSGAGVSSGSFDPALAGAGTHPITYSFTDVNGCTNTTTQNVYVDPSCIALGIASTSTSSGVAIYPNPTNGIFTLELGLSQGEKTEIKVINAIGQTILLQNHNFISGNNKTVIDLSGIYKGVYFVEIKTKSNVRIQRIILN